MTEAWGPPAMLVIGVGLGYALCFFIMRARVQQVIAALQELARLRATRHAEFMERAEREIRELEELIKREETR